MRDPNSESKVASNFACQHWPFTDIHMHIHEHVHTHIPPVHTNIMKNKLEKYSSPTLCSSFHEFPWSSLLGHICKVNGYIAEPGYKLIFAFAFVFFKAHEPKQERVENSASRVGDMSVHYTWDTLPSYQKREVTSDQTGKEKPPYGRHPEPPVSSLVSELLSVGS